MSERTTASELFFSDEEIERLVLSLAEIAEYGRNHAAAGAECAKMAADAIANYK